MERTIFITDFDEADYSVLKDSKAETTDLFLCYCGIQRCKPRYSYANDIRSDYLLHFILNGSGTFTLGGRSWALKEGDVFYIPPHTLNYRYTADAGNPWTYMWIGFNGNGASAYLDYTGLSEASPACTIQNIDEIYQVMQDLLHTKALSLPNDIKRDGYLYKILSLLIKSQQQSQNNDTRRDYSAQTYAIYAKNYIDHNFNSINIADVAHAVGIDRSYLHNVFKKNFHISPQQYLIKRRLEHAVSLLLTTELSIQQIALDCGYTDQLQFSKLFKKHYLQSPQAYRLLAKKEGGKS